jgi:hypothetical protein
MYDVLPQQSSGEFMKAGEALRWNEGTVIENH